MFVALEARTPCLVCGYLCSVFRFSRVRVNKNSLAELDSPLIAGERMCPECGHPCADQMVTLPGGWRLRGDDAAKVGEYRRRKFGTGDGAAGPFIITRRAA